MKRVKKVQGRTSIIVVIISVLGFIFSGFSYAQDLGVPDTVRFDPWGTYIPCPPCSGRAVVPLVIFNDEPLNYFDIPLQCTGPVACDSIEFIGNRVHSIGFLSSAILAGHKHLLLSGVSHDPDSLMPPGNGIVAHLHFTLYDTGMVTIEEGWEPPEPFLYFITPPDQGFIPVFVESEHHIVPQDVLPGDVNKSGEVNVVDIVFLINYLFRNGPEPAYPPCADPNVDCWVSISDVVYLINYVLKTGASPELGCAY
jgi:hypothetical protein